LIHQRRGALFAMANHLMIWPWGTSCSPIHDAGSGNNVAVRAQKGSET
jgi:hypothetical protein